MVAFSRFFCRKQIPTIFLDNDDAKATTTFSILYDNEAGLFVAKSLDARLSPSSCPYTTTHVQHPYFSREKPHLGKPTNDDYDGGGGGQGETLIWWS